MTPSAHGRGPVLAALLCGVLLAPPVLARGDAPRRLVPGTHKILTATRVSGVRRSYYVHVPPGHDGTTPLPVVLALHGAFSTARDLERYTGLSRLADRERFVAVYPQGIGLGDLFRHWNSGACCGKARKLDLDDVGFALGAVDDVARRIPVDRDRIYVLGHSNGGMLAYRIAAERPELVAALAVVSATVGGQASAREPEWLIPRPRRAVPLLAIHGRSDENVPYGGGRGTESHGTSTTVSVARSIDLWRDANGCTSPPSAEIDHGGRVEKRYWSGSGADVTLLSLEGWGHLWPGGPYTAKLPVGDPMRDFEAAEIIWQFFRRHGRTP